MRELLIAHAADFHLGSGDASVAKQRAGKAQNDGEGLAALASFFNFCDESDVDFISLAGDVFDKPQPEPYLIEEFYAIVSSVKNSYVHIVPGNHDPYTAESFWADLSRRLPANITISQPGGSYINYQEKGLSVWSAPFTSQIADTALLNELKPEALRDEINIVVLHGELVSGKRRRSYYNPIESEWFDNSNADLLLLGHIHNNGGLASLNRLDNNLGAASFKGFDFDGPALRRKISPSAGNSGDKAKLYAGFPRGRRFDETGPGGFRLLYLQKDPEYFTVREKYVHLKAPVFYNFDIDISQSDYARFSLDDEDLDEAALVDQPALLANMILDAIRHKISNEFMYASLPLPDQSSCGENDFVKVALKGESYRNPPMRLLDSFLSEHFKYVELSDLTVKPLKKDLLLHENSLRGEILSLARYFEEEDYAEEMAAIWPEHENYSRDYKKRFLQLCAEMVLRSLEGDFSADEFYERAAFEFKRFDDQERELE